MSYFLMTIWHGGGSTPPLMSVARSLVSRGHEVRVLADAILEDEVRAAGAAHVPWTNAPQRTRPDLADDHIRDWEPTDPLEEFGRMRDRLSVGPAGAYAHDVRAEIEVRRPAAVLTEALLMGPLLAGEATGVPVVALSSTINMAPTPGVPPFGPGFLPATTDAERELHAQVAEQNLAAWNVALPVLNAAREEHGLGPLGHVLEQFTAAARVLILSSAAFDFPGELPPVVKHVGPRLDDVAWAEPWTPPPGDDPLVLVALSSEFQDQADVLRRIVDGLRDLPVRGLVTTGRGVDPAEVAAPDHVQVRRSAPHSAVLPHAAAVVTHGGHGTVLKSLAAGVPLVCLPMGRDQHDIAARLEHSGAGIRLPASAAAASVGDAVRSVLDDPAYRAAAGRLAAAIAEETATDRAVAEIEALVGATVPA
ncbi:glycosyltransferase [Nocardioides sp. GCM10027113]|uniref:glycosyltransferase n=1 Tax=unclassified Nocardioides TaxID=2615069 RepID=UPI003614007A